MKTFIKSSKKFLSVFMAIMMIMTAWVFVEPSKAEALTAGNYEWQVNLWVKDNYDWKHDAMNVYVDYISNNGYGNYYKCDDSTYKNTTSYFSVSKNQYESDKADYYFYGSCPGFPCAVRLDKMKNNNSMWNANYQVRLEVKKADGTWERLYDSGKVTGIGAGSYLKKAEISTRGASNTQWPYVNSYTQKIDSTTTTTNTIKVEYDKTNSCKYIVDSPKDQYGIAWGVSPTWSVSTTNGTKGTVTKASTTETQPVTYSHTGVDYESTVTANFSGSQVKTLTWKTTVQNQHKLIINANNGTYSGTTPVYGYTNGTTTVSNPTRTGYTFTKWTSSDTNNSIHNTKNTTYTFRNVKDTTLTAQWQINSSTLTVNPNDGKWASDGTTGNKTNTGNYNTTYPIPTVIRDGYTFNGWTLSGTNGSINENVFTYGAGTAGNTATAQWSINQYPVTFTGENGYYVSGNYDYDSVITLPDTTPTKNSDETNHYAFTGWEGYTSGAKVPVGGVTYTAHYDPVPHSFESVTVPANCLHGTQTYKICETCGYKSDVVDDHILASHVKSDKYVSDTMPTCTESGTAHYICTVCGNDLDAVEISPLGHNYEKTITTPATCSTEGVATYTCTRCSDSYTETIAKLPHSFNTVVSTTDSTCSTPGSSVIKCDNCDATYTTVEGSWSGTNYTPAPVASHAYVVKGAEHGKLVIGCANCDFEIETTVDDTAAHDYDTVTVTAEPTCSAKGSVTVSCSGGDSATITVELPENTAAHELEGIYTASTECEVRGSYKLHCILCNEDVQVFDIDALGHDYSYVYVAPDCDNEGSITRVCSRCDNETVETLDALGHSVVTIPAVAATCEKTGLTEGQKCGVCGKTLVAQTETEALGHDYNGDVTIVDATCNVPGTKRTQCTRCDAATYEILSATGHDYATETVAPSCTAQGYDKHTCANCGDVYKDNYNDAVAHTWGDWETIAEPTCFGNGIKESKCTVCGCSKTDTINPLGHNLAAENEKIVAPDCYNDGYTLHICDRCGYQISDTVVPATGHVFGEWTALVPASCTGNGTDQRICTGCGFPETRQTDALEHSLTQITTTPATCESNAFTTYACENCDYSYIIETENTLLDHVFEVKSQQDSTCTEDGFTVSVCTLCGFEKTSVIPAKGHTYGDWEIIVEPTCDKEGTAKRVCINDSQHVEFDTVPATGEHEYVQTLVEPTCTQKGFTIFVCKTCGDTYQDLFVEELGHSYDDGVYQEVTCTTDGGTLYTCTRPGCSETEADHTVFESDTPALGHDMGNWYIIKHPTVANAYCKKIDCTRDKCKYFEYELAEDGSVNEYYKVEYFNDEYTPEDGYYTETDGSKLADPAKYETKLLYTTYVLKGEAAQYAEEVEMTPYKAPAKEYGRYVFTGWTVDQAGQSLDSVTKNLTAHAQFTGKEVYYNVTFYNWDGVSVIKYHQHILHGHAAEAPKTPSRPESLAYKYEFTGYDKDYSHIYGNVSVVAQYNEIAKQYKVIYHDYDGTVLGSEIFNIGDAATAAPTGLTREADSRYTYKFIGWQYASGQNFNTKKLNVLTNYSEYVPANESDDTLTDAQKGICNVYAVYSKTENTYNVKVVATDEMGNVASGATIKIYDKDKMLVASATVLKNPEVQFDLIGGTYTVKVTYSDETLETVLVVKANGDSAGVVFPIKEINEEVEDCGCFCHVPLLGKIYTFFRNLLNKLTGNTKPCCPDHV